ncbi:MAG: hypothetical protein Q8P72_06410 [Candidatus Roizmanbacteria bacterium]|nr:hypothetical protein [Candidatus Roizmanbacteria bacterium]
MSQSSYIKKLDLELERIFELQPNDLHVPALTYMYKKLTRPLKSLPIVYIVPLSIGSAIFMYLVFGPMVVRLVSLLQYGF